MPPTNDYGTDLLAEKDDIKYAIQCKYYNSKVGIKAVQEIMGGKEYYNTHVAVVLTNNFFTKSAIKLAEGNNIILWNGKKLDKMVAKAKRKE